MRDNAVTRIRFITGAILLLALLLIGRLYQLQILKGDQYKERAEKQYVHTVHDLFERGNIFLTTKEGEHVSAATIQSGYLLAIDPSHIEDIEATYAKLNAVTAIDHDLFVERASKKDKTYQEIVEQLSDAVAEQITVLKIPGVQLYRNQWRYYPGNELAARTIGFIGYSGNDLAGRYGLERYYDDVLSRDTEHYAVNFFAEIFSNLGSLVFDSKDTKRGDIVTTIEPTVARMLDSTLEKVQKEWGSDMTGGIIINPRTGEVYALSIAPTFNLNDRAGVEIESFENPLVESVYEMGSIIKPLTMAAGIDSKAVSRNSTYYDAGFVEMNSAKIWNYDHVGRGTVSMQEVLNQSLNTGVAYIVKTMGKEKFRNYFTNLKLGSETGIDLPGETYGLINNLQSPRDVEYATASFGQGIALTPIETARALSTLANGGVLVTPHIVSEILYDNGKAHKVGFPEGERVYSEATTEEVTRMLVTVVDDALRGGKVKMEDYAIAAKTGTAQIADPVNGGYYEDRFLHSFFGYFPAYDPQFMVFLYTVEPKGVKYASETLTDPFMDITKFLINYYDIPPDR